MTDPEIAIIEPDANESRYLIVVRDAGDATAALFEELGLQGGGYTWEALAHALISLKAPELKSELEIHAEGDEMYAYVATLEPLKRFEALVRAACADHSLLRAAMAEAGDDLE